MRITFTDTPNDKLLVKLLKIRGVAPLYRQGFGGQPGSLDLLAVTVYVDAYNLLTGERLDAIECWAMEKCGVKKREAVTVAPWTEPEEAPGEHTS